MPENGALSLDDIAAVILDFDGVLTDNSVYVSDEGREFVKCSRSDGLAFDALRKLEIKSFILSTESNPVVSKRGEKLQVSVLQGSSDKSESLKRLSADEGFPLENVIYIGNDINDIDAMTLCGYKFCPSDSHPTVQQLADRVLSAGGGEGVVRELVEEFLMIDLYKVLYEEKV